MKARMTAAALALILALPLAANAAGPQGFAQDAWQAEQARQPQGFGPSGPVTVEHVLKNGADDEIVILRGRFTKHIRGDKYEFQDEAGNAITAELDDDDDWSMIRRGALTEIRAKIDRDWNSTKIEVKAARSLEK